MTRDEKAAVLDVFTKEWSGAIGAVLLDFRGLTVAEVTGLRKKLRIGGVRMRVIKNTLAKRAVGKRADALASFFKGPTAVAISTTDAVAPARLLQDAKKDLEKLTLKAAVVEGEVFDGSQIAALAALPTREELRGQVTFALMAPLTGLVGTLAGILREFVGTVDALRVQRERDAPPTA